MAVVVGFVFALVFLWWVSNGGWWLEFVICDFFVIVDFVGSGLREKIKDLDWWLFLSCCELLVVEVGVVVVVVDVYAVLVFFFWMFLLLF